MFLDFIGRHCTNYGINNDSNQAQVASGAFCLPGNSSAKLAERLEQNHLVNVLQGTPTLHVKKKQHEQSLHRNDVHKNNMDHPI